MIQRIKKPVPKPGVAEAPLYIPGDHKVPGFENPIVLSANENPLGPGQSAMKAYQDAVGKLHRYPDGGAFALRAGIAKAHHLDAERVIIGNGSDELITLVTRAYAGVGDEVLYSRHGFAMYHITALGVGATPVAAPEIDLSTDVEAILSHVSAATKLVFIANPNNPTGSYISQEKVRYLLENLPSHILCVLDAAYAEYVMRNDYEAGAAFVDRFDNVLMLRTFSKIHGLAALRLGWGYGSAPIIEAMNRLRGPFNTNAPALAAGLAAVQDDAHIVASCDHNIQWLSWMRTELQALGLSVPPSVGNFIIVEFRDAETAKAASAFLASRGIIARDIASYHLPQFVRLTVGLEVECRQAVAAIAEFLNQV